MNVLETIGGFVLNKTGVFVAFIVALLAVPIAVNAYTGGKTAEVTSKEFVCTATSSVGIEPRCDQYTRIKSPTGLQ